MRIGKTREQQQRLRQQRRERAAELVRIGLTHKQIAERLGVAGSTVAALLAESADGDQSTVRDKAQSG
jgi:DNA-binding NarL/FixJ family response regulator